MNPFTLLPNPRSLTVYDEKYQLQENKLILINIENPQQFLFSAQKIKDHIRNQLGVTWEITASDAIPDRNIGLEFQLRPELVGHPQGYRLTISSEKIRILGHDPAGIFYGVCTLRQILHNNKHSPSRQIPCLDILDWPDFPSRGVMLDISRDKVPSMQTLYQLIDMLAGIKINQFQLYTEHTFAYHQHPIVWKEASPITGEEILEIDRYCRERFIELVPNQNSFGHMHRWLQFPEYAPLGELYQIETDQWWGKGSFSLCPINPHSIEFIRSLYDELLPHFSNRMFNIGCDETFDLGLGHSRSAVEQHGKGRVYLDFLLQLYADVSQRGRSIQFWGDIVLEHPELVPHLPRDLIALEWGYEAEHPFEDRTEKFAEAGIPFYVCPGTSSWNSIAGRTDNALQNLNRAALIGLRNGAIGYLNTDWGDNGHWQVLPVSYLGFAAGSAYSWNIQANQSLDLLTALNRFIFDDPADQLGYVAFSLGNVYKAVNVLMPNSSVLFHILQNPIKKLKEYLESWQIDAFDQAEQIIEEAASRLESANPLVQDGALIKREFKLAAQMLAHAIKRSRFVLSPTDSLRKSLLKDWQETMNEYQLVWHLRNRPGGFRDSFSRFQTALSDYKNP